MYTVWTSGPKMIRCTFRNNEKIVNNKMNGLSWYGQSPHWHWSLLRIKLSSSGLREHYVDPRGANSCRLNFCLEGIIAKWCRNNDNITTYLFNLAIGHMPGLGGFYVMCELMLAGPFVLSQSSDSWCAHQSQWPISKQKKHTHRPQQIIH